MSFVISRKGKWELSEAALGQKCERHNGKIIFFFNMYRDYRDDGIKSWYVVW